MEKRIGFMTHALHRCVERGLTTTEAEALIKTGLKLTPTEKNQWGVVRPYENDGWRFIVFETKASISVITAYRRDMV